ncbi:response regulator [Scytonema hofmannii FACHB-248]|uniref:histidine kinase n=2 Tax=Scytonema hofmannii TaxID=34078 RepID=A0ABR8GTX1_9CYAN|nr:response regulator [[Scytonema hofmanni] UTEX B 1581]MBD2606466.1 response regulator [Scytonema hofmannii FACHB-248]
MFEAVRQSIISPRDKQMTNNIQMLVLDIELRQKLSKQMLPKLFRKETNRKLPERQFYGTIKAIAQFFISKSADFALFALLYKLLIHYISQLKQAEHKIREQAALLDVATDAIFVKNIQNQILFWNKSAEVLYGWKVEEVIGKDALALLYEDLPHPESALLTVIKNGYWQGELKQVQKNGDEILVESRWTLVRDEFGQPQSILIVNTEITQKKQLEAELLRSQRLECIGTLAGGIAHDLNNVLAPILLAVPLLQMKLSDPQSEHLLKMLENNVKRGANLVRQILSFARGIECRQTTVKVKSLLTEIEDIITGTFSKSITCHTYISDNIWHVHGNATQLHQVLMNLVVNARDAMPDGGIMTISAENILIDEYYAKMHIDAQVGSYVAITIADTGIGIPQAIQERIFEPFFTTKEVGKGTGLGLSTALGIIKNHGGFVNLYSEVNKGTQFQIYLPSSTKVEIDPPFEELEPLTGNGELILVVDDEAAIRDLTKSTLETYNYQVLTASDGVEAVAIYAQHQQEISVVLLDMMMPWMDGAIAIRTLQKINPHVKIIAMSGLLSNQNIAESAGTGVKGFLSKPCTARELLQAINSTRCQIH